MKEKNEPVLFVNSVSVYRGTDRKSTKVKLHRLDDVKVLLNLNQIVEVEVEYNDIKIIGLIKEINSNDIIIEINNIDTKISLSNITNLQIVSTK